LVHLASIGVSGTTWKGLIPLASQFSFNSAVGACDTCRGFGRVIGVDYGLVIPNPKLTLRAGAIKPMQTPAWQE
jgi:excinuclease ABC subunit A